MFLSSIHVTNFRSCDQTIVKFHEDLTILAGENNAGKTNVLDAIRLLTSPTDGRRARFAEREDVRRDTGATFEVVAEFGALSDEQRTVRRKQLGRPGPSGSPRTARTREPASVSNDVAPRPGGRRSATAADAPRTRRKSKCFSGDTSFFQVEDRALDRLIQRGGI
jgi:DNA repair exonuclease SbcCD ATPase subunit